MTFKTMWICAWTIYHSHHCFYENLQKRGIDKNFQYLEFQCSILNLSAKPIPR